MKHFLPSPYIVDFSTLDTQCCYLKDKKTRMQYKYIKNCNFELNNALTTRGWRRFGEYFSRPQCKNCKECLSVKIDAENFVFSKSVRRVFKKNQDQTRILIKKPSATREHVELYNKYHAFMREKRGWEFNKISLSFYYELFVSGHGNFGLEFLYFKDGKLIGVDIVDVLHNGLSSIYFFYDPNYAYLNLGKYSIYQQILYALNKNKRWIYLGYFVKDCQSLNYKSSYKPLEVLINNPQLSEEPIWKRQNLT